MSVMCYMRGHLCFYDFNEGAWFYADNNKSAKKDRPCIRCGKMPTEEGHDACLGKLPNTKNACCGHGVQKRYIESEKK